MVKRRQYGTGSISQMPDGRWRGRLEAGWTASGTRRRISVIAKTEAEAKRRLRDKRIAMEREDADATVNPRENVKSWSATWLSMVEHQVRPKTYSTDSSAIRRWVIPTIGHRKLRDLTPGDIRRITDAIRDAGRSTTTAGYVQRTTVRMLKAARQEGHQISDRVLSVKAPAAEVSTRDAIPLTDALEILHAGLRREDGPRWAAALMQGMRQGEALGLTWECVDLDAGVVDVSWQLQELSYRRARVPSSGARVPDGYRHRHLVGRWHLVQPKSRAGMRRVPLLPEMVEALRRWQEVAPASPHDLVFPDAEGGPRTPAADRAEWVELQDEAQVAKIEGIAGRRYVLHEARHTTATLLLAARVDPEVIKAILGHSSIAVSRGYQHADIEMARAAMAEVGRVLLPGRA